MGGTTTVSESLKVIQQLDERGPCYRTRRMGDHVVHRWLQETLHPF